MTSESAHHFSSENVDGRTLKANALPPASELRKLLVISAGRGSGARDDIPKTAPLPTENLIILSASDVDVSNRAAK